MTPQLRYTNDEVETLKALFPNADSIKMLRKYLLNLALTKDEKAQIKAHWTSQGAQAVIRQVVLPEATGNEAIGVSYDNLNNIPLEEKDLEFVERRTQAFVNSVIYLDGRLKGLRNVGKATKKPAQWLTTRVLDNQPADTTTLINDLIIKKTVEGTLTGLQALVLSQVETPSQRADRLKANSTK